MSRKRNGFAVGQHIMFGGAGAVVVAIGRYHQIAVKWDNGYDGDFDILDADDCDPYEGPYPNGERVDQEIKTIAWSS